MKVLVAGDFCQRDRVDAYIKNRRFGDLFDEVKPLLQKVDYSIVNFEFPIVSDNSVVSPIVKCGPNLKGTNGAVEALVYAGFNCCTLANNHILDQGQDCCIETIKQLENAGIDTIGAGKDLSEAGKVLYKQINGETLAVINCCEHEFTIASKNSAGANPLNPINQFYAIQEAKTKADFVLVIVHGGHEHYQLPSPRMQEIYRFFVDVGADAVVNHHQHCFSGYEFYKETPIIYGLGNLCFDHPKKRKDNWNEGYIANIEFKKNSKVKLDIIPYFQCNESVGVNLNEDNADFFMKLDKLNKIICSQELEKEYKIYLERRGKVETLVHLPFTNKVLMKLHSMGIMPSFVSRRKWAKLLNYIETESHRDIQIEAIKSKL